MGIEIREVVLSCKRCEKFRMKLHTVGTVSRLEDGSMWKPVAYECENCGELTTFMVYVGRSPVPISLAGGV